LICVPIIGKRLDELHIPQMVSDNTAVHETAFTVSVEARGRTTTGISAQDRARRSALLDPGAKPADFLRPGHTFPLRARDGGVLVRAGQTEAAVDLARLAGLYPAGVIVEIMDDDGTMMRLAETADVRQEARSAPDHRQGSDRVIACAPKSSSKRIAEFALPTTHGMFSGIAYETRSTITSRTSRW
jgi:3,4-dihydroxy 2-butanone 4-phosphate synthase/GTP cyclohydrolase II